MTRRHKRGARAAALGLGSVEDLDAALLERVQTLQIHNSNIEGLRVDFSEHEKYLYGPWLTMAKAELQISTLLPVVAKRDESGRYTTNCTDCLQLFLDVCDGYRALELQVLKERAQPSWLPNEVQLADRRRDRRRVADIEIYIRHDPRRWTTPPHT